MNFFEQQDRAHRNTKRLIFLLCLAVLSLIAITTLLVATVLYYSQLDSSLDLQAASFWQGLRHSISWKILGSISLGVCTVILVGSLYKSFQLSGGGRAVAEAMGGRLISQETTDHHERKILNVVEEMAIASGTPVPPVYLLEDDAINAFAAGYTPQDAVIGITRGCISLLKRDELQGVIAHEFSHIFHGDMKLNMRLVALLNGILLLGLIGEVLLRNSGHHSVSRSSRNKSSVPIIGMGLGLVVIGYTGTFFGHLIKSAVSRQREFLADASAVKFTRNPCGIADALKKIGGNATGSQLGNSNAAEFSHMYFSQGVHAGFSQLMATHPPLEKRIQRIEPRWDGEFIDTALAANSLPDDALTQQNLHNPIEFVVAIDSVLETIGQPTAEHLIYAQQTLNSIDEKVHQATHNPWEAQALMFGLLLDKIPAQQEQQWRMLATTFSAEQLDSLKFWAVKASNLLPELRLPLVELSLPALKQLSPAQYHIFKQTLFNLIHTDQQVNLLEWSYCRILTHNLEVQTSTSRQLNLQQLEKESITLLSVVAYAGASCKAEAQTAFNSSKAILELHDAIMLEQSAFTMLDVDIAISRLNNLKPLQKPKLLKAISLCIMHDQKTTICEAELFRAIADGLNCPIPPLIIN